MHSSALKGASIYDRGVLAKTHREVKLQALRDQKFQQECTFAPTTSTTKQTSRTGSIIRTSNRRGSIIVAEAPRTSVLPTRPPVVMVNRKDNQSRTGSSVVSHRLEDLYHQQVMKMRMKPKTSTQERAYRDELYEERELQRCTFKPQLQVYDLPYQKQAESAIGSRLWATRTQRSNSKPNTTPLRFNKTIEPQRVPKEIVFAVEEPEIHSILMDPFESNHLPGLAATPDQEEEPQRPLLFMDEADPIHSQLAKEGKLVRPKPGKVYRKHRSRRRRSVDDAELDIGSV